MINELIDAYRCDGYAIARGLIDSELIHEMDAHYEWLRAQPQPENVSPMKDGPLHEIDAFTVRAAGDPRLLELVSPIIGPAIALEHADYVPKDPGSDRTFGWHADAMLIGQMFDDMERFAQVWIALDPATKESGCLRALRGSHVSGWQSLVPESEWGSIWQVLLDKGLAREEDAVDIELDPGDVLLFHGWTLHSSNPNRSSRRRCGFNFHYIDAAVGYKLEGQPPGVVLQGRDGGHEWQPLPRWTQGRDFAFHGAEAFA